MAIFRQPLTRIVAVRAQLPLISRPRPGGIAVHSLRNLRDRSSYVDLARVHRTLTLASSWGCRLDVAGDVLGARYPGGEHLIRVFYTSFTAFVNEEM